MPDKLTVEQVKSEVRRFWSTFASKDSRSLARFYAGSATVFNPSSSRQELGPVSAARRDREYFQRDTQVHVRLGEIRVDLLGVNEESAVASYTFQFHATNVVTAAGLTAEDIQLGRATHVFARTEEGQMHIMHEHLSLPTWPGAAMLVPPAYASSEMHSHR